MQHTRTRTAGNRFVGTKFDGKIEGIIHVAQEKKSWQKEKLNSEKRAALSKFCTEVGLIESEH